MRNVAARTASPGGAPSTFSDFIAAGGAQAAADQMHMGSSHGPVGDKTRSSLVSQIGPDPIEKHGRPVPPSGQEQDMGYTP